MFNMQNIMQMMNNPMVKSIMNSNNPQQMALNMLKNSPNANTDVGRNIIGMLERGDMKGLEQYGKNLVQSQGMDPNQVMNMINQIK